MSSFTDDLEYEFTGSYFRGNPLYIITKSFQYKLGDIKNPLHTFTIPAGYITDLASIYWPVNLFLKPHGPWAKAAVLHDFIITEYPEVSKVIGDSVFLEAMIVLGVNSALAYIFYLVVRSYNLVINREL